MAHDFEGGWSPEFPLRYFAVMSYRTLQTSFVSEIPPPQTRQDTRAGSRDIRKTAAVSCHVIVHPSDISAVS